MKNIAVITYDKPHTKTSMIVGPLASQSFSITLVECAFTPRKPRQPVIQHRPEMFPADSDKSTSALHRIPIDSISGKAPYDFFVIAGAGILTNDFIENNIVLNAHAGLLPNARGLDAFKWSLLTNQPLGVTVHIIDKQTDAGWIVAQRETPIFVWDTIETLASRHYRNEIALFLETIHTFDPTRSYPRATTEFEPTMRMKLEQEQQLIEEFPSIISRRAISSSLYTSWL